MERKEELYHRLLLTASLIVLCAVILLVVLRFTDSSGEYVYSVIEDGAITIDGYTGSPSMLEVPDKIDGMEVRAISEGAFTAQTKLKKIVLPATVTEIGSTAFADCKNLSRVDASGVEIVREAAFQGCEKLRDITLSQTLTDVEAQAFQGCGQLRTLTAPATLTEIGADAFAGCGNLVLLCEENPTAAEVAEQYGISTALADSNRVMLGKIALATAGLGALIAVAWIVLRKVRRSREER